MGVEAIAVEASRRLRKLMASSFLENGVLSRVKIVPAFITLNASDSGSVDLVHDVGHFTVGAHSMAMPAERGSAALPKVHEAASGYLTTLPTLLGSTRVDLLMMSPGVLCSAMSEDSEQNLHVRCRRRMDQAVPGREMCAFLDCRAVEVGDDGS